MKRILFLGFILSIAAPLVPAATPPVTIEEQGAGDPILFLPCLGCRAEVWNQLVQRLPGHRMALVSIAGFGGVPGRQTGFEAVRDALAQLIRAKHWRNLTLAGHSFGGSLALSLAAAHRDLFARVVILDAYPFPAALARAGATPGDARQVAALLRQAITGLDAGQFRNQQAQALHMMITGEPQFQTVLGWTLASDRETLAQAQFESVSTDLRPLLPRISCPLLVLGSWRGREPLGMSQSSVEATLKEQYRDAPDCRIEVSPSARHFLQLDDPDWVAARIASFLHP